MKLTIGVFGEPKSGKTRTAVCIGQFLKKAGIKKVAIIDDSTVLDKSELPKDLEVTIVTAGLDKKGSSKPKSFLPMSGGTKRYL